MSAEISNSQHIKNIRDQIMRVDVAATIQATIGQTQPNASNTLDNTPLAAVNLEDPTESSKLVPHVFNQPCCASTFTSVNLADITAIAY